MSKYKCPCEYCQWRRGELTDKEYIQFLMDFSQHMEMKAYHTNEENKELKIQINELTKKKK